MIMKPTVAWLFVSAVPAVSGGYCNWGPLGTAASSTCDLEVEGGNWCNVNQNNCESGCIGKWCTNDGGGGGGGGGGGNPAPPPSTKTATTTRYWDCSGGSCACAYVPAGLGEGDVAHCHSNAMFAAPAGNIHGAKFYGAAAISSALGGGDWMSEGCGKCWKVTASSNIQGRSGVETTLVLKGTNFCPDGNPLCRAGPHFDIAAPGFDVLQFSISNSCTDREPDEVEGFAACSNWLINNSDPNANCDCSLFNDPVLRKGCENFYGLNWNNPVVTYNEVTCPEELSRLHCAHPYAFEATTGIPEFCESNVETTPPSPPTPTNPPPTPVPPPTTPGPNYCGCSGCDQAIWDTPATGIGGTYTCGARIAWLQSSDGGSRSEYDACILVAGEEFPGVCGPKCNPATCGEDRKLRGGGM